MTKLKSLSSYRSELEVWNDKFGSPAAEVISSKNYTNSEEGIERATIFKLRNGLYAFVTEYSPNDNYGYGDADIYSNLSKKKAEKFMNEYVENHERRTNAFDEMVQEILNEFIGR